MKQIEGQIEGYLRYCELVRRMTATTLRQKWAVLHYFARVTGVGRVEEVTNAVFDEWVCVAGRSASARSVNMYNAVVVAMVRYYREMGVRAPVNLSLVGKLKETETRRRFYTAREIDAVVRGTDLVTGLMIRIMFETGMRIAELCRLRASDFEGRRVRFIGKGRKLREVYVTEETLGLVLSYVERYGVTGYLWAVFEDGVTLNGEPPVEDTVRKRLKRAFSDAGFSDFYPHSLRHSFATDLQLRGASVAEIKEMIGHENIATTERYLHGFEGRMRELFDKYR